jgi:hypothetical protein
MDQAGDTAASAQAASSAGGSGTVRSLPSAAGDPTGNPYQMLAAAINAQLALLYHTSVTLVQFPSQGNLLWYYQNGDQIFNDGTFGYISARVGPGDAAGLAKLSGPGGYPNAYLQLLSQVEYGVGSADVAAGNQAAIRQAAAGNALLTALRQATSTPTVANGGMLTVDPNTGAVSSSCQVGYAVNAALATLSNGLQAEQPTLTVQVPASSGTSATISYPGCLLVPVQASAWQQATNVGWYDPDPLTQAASNGQRDVTGFRFTSDPSYNLGTLGSAGNFGQLTALLISGTPVVTFSGAAKRSFAAVQTAQIAADFFESLSLLHLDPGTETGLFLVTGAANGPTVPLMQQSAYVVGAALSFIAPD